MEKNNFMDGKVITITGGTGSFGKTVLKSILSSNAKSIRVLSRDENKQDILRKEFNNSKIEFYIGDVRDKRSLLNCFDGSDYVFHAAALKQVPSCEFNVFEAVKTNVLGSQNVIDASLQCNVSKTLMLSTDKAAMPVNAMGMTKALMEKLTASVGLGQHSRGNTVFSITRYGNVMGSRGSVIPIFIEQLLSNNFLTVTDPKMTRFMMSLNESVDLVLYALQNCKQSELFVQKAPSSSIEVLIEALEIIFNKKANTKIIGWRHSEKMHETLLTTEESSRSIDMGNYYCVKPDDRGLDYENYNSLDDKLKTEFNSSNAYSLNAVELVDILLKEQFIQNYINNGLH